MLTFKGNNDHAYEEFRSYISKIDNTVIDKAEYIVLLLYQLIMS